jgi:hypothetical protein
MGTQLNAVVIDDDTIFIEGRILSEQSALVDLFRSAVASDPGLLLVVSPRTDEHFKGIGKVIYASQRAGVPVANLRYRSEDGKVLTFDQLRARDPD